MDLLPPEPERTGGRPPPKVDFVTANVTSYDTLLKYVETLESDFVAVQEAKVTEDMVEAYKLVASGKGYQAEVAPCEGSGNKKKAGVVCMWKQEFSLAGLPSILVPQRAVSITPWINGFGYVMFIAAYGYPGDRMNDEGDMDNLLAKVTDHAIQSGLPFMIAADFDQPPDIIRQWLYAHGVEACVRHRAFYL